MIVNRIPLLALGIVLLSACGQGAAPGASTLADEASLLCSAALPGERPDAVARIAVDPRPPQRAQAYVERGQRFVLLARREADPGFFLNVRACAAMAESAVPAMAAARELVALDHLENHRFGEAREVATAILADDPARSEALGVLADAELELGHYDAATDAVQKQLDLHPSPPAYARAAWLRWLRGDFAGATRMYKDALAGLDPSRPEAAAWLLADAATVYAAAGDRDGAIALADAALARWPSSAPALLIRARIDLADGKPSQGVSRLAPLLQTHRSLEAEALAVEAAEAMGDDAAAKQHFDALVAIGRRGDALGLGNWLAQRGDQSPQALALIEQERRARGGVFVDDARALALLRNGRLAEARAASDAALATGIRDPRIRLHAALIRYAQGEHDGARALVTDVFESHALVDAGLRAEAGAILATRRVADTRSTP